MKIAYASDLHIEFRQVPAHQMNLPDADLLVLAGDITAVSNTSTENRHGFTPSTSRLYQLMTACYDKYGKDNVIYIPGNHEHYGSYDVHQTGSIINGHLREIAKRGLDIGEDVKYSPDGFLQEENIRVRNIPGLGKVLTGTMWTSFNNNDPFWKMRAQDGLNDYNKIREIVDDVPSLLSPETVYKLNTEFINALYVEKPDVVFSHHTPHRRCDLGGHGKTMQHLYYCSTAERIIESRSNNIKLWICGHTHDSLDIEVNGTRIVNNPRGYDGYESSADVFQFKVIEV